MNLRIANGALFKKLLNCLLLLERRVDAHAAQTPVPSQNEHLGTSEARLQLLVPVP
jgi:hypothetical protein